MSIYNMIFASVLGSIISSTTQLIPNVITMLVHVTKPHLKKIYTIMFGQYNEVILTSVLEKTSFYATESSPIEYDAVMFKINSKHINTFSVKNKYANKNPQSMMMGASREIQDNDKITANYNICSNELIKISKKHEIYVKCDVDDGIYDISNNKDKNTIVAYNMRIMSKKLSVPAIILKIENWRIKYINHQKCYIDDGNLYYYYLDKQKQNNTGTNNNIDFLKLENQSNCASQTEWNKYKMTTTKSFDNLFFDGKNKLLNRLNYFLDNKQEYSRKGIPYNMGLLFYGEPGCGKTSCIKALSTYTKRNIVEINLKNIKTCGEFIDAFRNEFINGDYIPIDKRIIVLEDIDCMIDIVKQRYKQPPPINDNHSDNGVGIDGDGDGDVDIDSNSNTNSKSGNNPTKTDNDMSADTDMINVDTMLKVALIDSFKKNRTDNSDSLTLSCILNTIDGVLEQDGRIIIITTNYKDKLDDALLRPGRIDMKMEFTKCSSEISKNLVEHFYNDKLPNGITLHNNLHSPAEIIEKCFNNSNNINDVIKILS